MKNTGAAPNHLAARLTAAIATLACLLALSGCGSTKVYTADKTMVYEGNLYNLAQVQQIGSRVDVALPNGMSVDAGSLDKDGVKSLLKEHDSLTVSTIMLLDDRELVYEKQKIDSYSDYSKQMKRFEKAQKSVGKFMSDAKKTQLELK